MKANNRVVKVSVGKEKKSDNGKYRILSKSKKGRSVYRAVFWAQFFGMSLRETSKNKNVSEATVFRIRKEMQKVKHILWLISTFLVTFSTFILSSWYTPKIWLQFIISGCITGTVILFTYSDVMRQD